MTIKILLDSRTKFEPFNLLCGTCMSTLEVGDQKDIAFRSFLGPSELGPSKLIYIICPVCNHEVIIPRDTGNFNDLLRMAELDFEE